MIKAFIWDLDGVITDTSNFHREAWIEALRLKLNNQSYDDISERYDQFFSGVPRLVGIKRFLESTKTSSKDNDVEVIAKKIADFKNQLFREKVSKLKINIYEDAVNLLSWGKEHGIKNGLASQSENADFVLEKTNLKYLLDAAATGLTAKKNSIPSKPDPAFYRHAADLLGFKISECVVFEDTYAGAFSAVTAGANFCVGVARNASSTMELASAGCDIITRDLDQLRKIINIVK